MKNLYLTVPAFLLLTACGGGSSNPTTEPEREVVETTEEEQQNADIADEVTSEEEQPDDIIEEVIEEVIEEPTEEGEPVTSETFTLPSLKMVASGRRNEEGGLLGLEQLAPALDDDAQFTLIVNSDGTLALEQGSRSVPLFESETDPGVYRGNVGQGDEATELDVTFIPEFAADDVFTGLLISVNFDERIEGYIPVGVVSAESIVDARTGTATFTGLMNGRITGPRVTADPNATEAQFTAPINGLGGGSLTVDFDANTVDGSFSLTHPTNAFNVIAADDEFPRMNVTLSGGTIAGDGFSGDATIAFPDGGGLGAATLTPNADGSFTGNFYGDTAASAGGTVSNTFDKDGDTFIFQGGFSTNE